MNIMRIVGLAGCTDPEMGRFLKNTAAGLADSACRSASNCSTGMRRDPLAPKPAWQTGGAAPKDSPYWQTPSR